MLRTIKTLTSLSKAVFKSSNTIKVSKNSKASLNLQYYFNYSSINNNDKIKAALSGIMVDVQGQPKSIIDSGLVVHYKFEDSLNKVVVVVNTGKEFAKVKNVLKRSLLKSGF